MRTSTPFSRMKFFSPPAGMTQQVVPLAPTRPVVDGSNASAWPWVSAKLIAVSAPSAYTVTYGLVDASVVTSTEAAAVLVDATPTRLVAVALGGMTVAAFRSGIALAMDPTGLLQRAGLVSPCG